MQFWKDHAILRQVSITLFFAAGIVLVIIGWRMTGQMAGLILMLLGVALLLAALYIYNKPFQGKKRRKQKISV